MSQRALQVVITVLVPDEPAAEGVRPSRPMRIDAVWQVNGQPRPVDDRSIVLKVLDAALKASLQGIEIDPPSLLTTASTIPKGLPQ